MNYDQVMQAKKSGQPLGMEDKMVAYPPMPPELESLGMQVQQKEDEAFSMASPQGDFHVKPLNQVVDALNQVLPLFGIEPYAKFTEDARILPPEFTRLLMMVAKAAEDSGVTELELDDVATDRDLTLLAGKLASLARNRDFKDFLKQPPSPSKTAEPPKTPSQGGEMSDSEMEQLFVSRA